MYHLEVSRQKEKDKDGDLGADIDGVPGDKKGRRYKLRFGRCSPWYLVFRQVYNLPVFA